MTDPIELGKRLELARNRSGLSLVEVADAVGVAVSTIQRYEKGKIQRIKLPVIESIAKALHVNPNWLLQKADSPEEAFLMYDTYMKNESKKMGLVISDTDPQIDQILSNAKKLNAQGLARLEQYSEDLTGNPIYQKKTMPK